MASNPPIFGHSSTKPIPQSFCNPQNHPTMDEVGPMKPSNPGEKRELCPCHTAFPVADITNQSQLLSPAMAYPQSRCQPTTAGIHNERPGTSLKSNSFFILWMNVVFS